MGSHVAINLKLSEPGIHLIEGEDQVHQMLHEASGVYSSVRIQVRAASAANTGAPTEASPGDRMSLKGNLSEVRCTEKGFVVEFPGIAQALAAAEACEKAAKEGHEILLIVASPRKQVFLGMRFKKARTLPRKGDGSTEIIFDFPEKLHQIQRRRDVRWVIPGAYEVTVEVPAPDPTKPQSAPVRTHFPMVDLSRSGMSFRTETEAQALLFRQGITLPQLTFVLQGRKYTVDGEVTSEKPISLGKRGYKIGIRFIRVDEEDGEALQEFVLVAALHLVA